MTLTEFLTARLDEDEAVARGSGLVAWLTYRHPDGSMDHTEIATSTVDAPDVWISAGAEAEGFTSVTVIHDERHVLADIAAKQRMVREWEAGLNLQGCDGVPLVRTYAPHRALLKATEMWLYYLAQPYREHPDFDPTWRINLNRQAADADTLRMIASAHPDFDPAWRV